MFFTLFYSGCARYTTIRTHSDFNEVKSGIKKILIVSPDIEIIHIVDVDEYHRDTVPEKNLQKYIFERTPKLFQEKGYDITMYQSGHLESLQNNFRTASDKLYKTALIHIDDAKQCDVFVGKSVKQVAVEENVDALLFIRYRGFQKSGKMVFKSLPIGLLLAYGAGDYSDLTTWAGRAEIALVDGKSGKVLISNMIIGHDDDIMLCTAGRIHNKALSNILKGLKNNRKDP